MRSQTEGDRGNKPTQTTGRGMFQFAINRSTQLHLRREPFDVDHPDLMLPPLTQLLDFVQGFCCNVLRVAVLADNQRDVFNNQQVVATTERLSDRLDLSGTTADGADRFIHSR
jgi:hypothetical protein